MLAFCLANSLQIIVFQAKNCGKSNHISLVESLLMLLQRDSSKSSEQGGGPNNDALQNLWRIAFEAKCPILPCWNASYKGDLTSHHLDFI